MIVRGSIFRGLNYIGNPTLGTIGKLVYWRDHQKAIGLFDTNRVNSWGDLSSNNYNLIQGSSPRLPRQYSDGIGMLAGDTGQPRLLNTGADLANAKCLHDGSPFLMIDVLTHDNTGQSSGDIILRVGGPSFSKAGFLYQILTSNSLSHTFYNDAGSSLGNHATGASTIPNDTRIFIMYTYYGSGGSSNSRLTIANTNYTTTRNPTFGIVKGTGMDSFFPQTASPANTAKHELSVAWDLTGKTITQVNDFVTLAIATMKSDSRYSGLTTI